MILVTARSFIEFNHPFEVDFLFIHTFLFVALTDALLDSVLQQIRIKTFQVLILQEYENELEIPDVIGKDHHGLKQF